MLSGDPSKNGLYVVRLKMPAGYKIPAHNHPTTENVTVVSGNFHIGMGDYLDEKKGIELTSGGYGEAPAKMNHYAWVTTPTIVQVHGQGPFAITYVNPATIPAPRNSQAAQRRLLATRTDIIRPGQLVRFVPDQAWRTLLRKRKAARKRLFVLEKRVSNSTRRW